MMREHHLTVEKDRTADLWELLEFTDDHYRLTIPPESGQGWGGELDVYPAPVPRDVPRDAGRWYWRAYGPAAALRAIGGGAADTREAAQAEAVACAWSHGLEVS